MAPKENPTLTEKDKIRFNAKFSISEGCWIWSAACSNRKRAVFWADSRQNYAARIAWIIHRGTIPDNMYVCHSCDNPKCVNPEHLFLGTAFDNHNDMVSKGRRARFIGSSNSQAKLTTRAVRLMREIYASGLKSSREIGEEFGVCGAVAMKAIRGTTWSHIK